MLTKKQKRKAKNKVYFFHFRYGLIIVLAYLFGFWLAFPFRKVIRKNKDKSKWYKFWYVFLDNSDAKDGKLDFGDEKWRIAKGYSIEKDKDGNYIKDTNIWIAARWQLFRNPAYNYHYFEHPDYYDIKNESAEIVILEYVKCSLQTGEGEDVSCFEFARMRWINNDGSDNSNYPSGNGVDWKNSYLGETEIYYKVKATGNIFYRKSACWYDKKRNQFRTKKFGANHRRYVWHNKWQDNE